MGKPRVKMTFSVVLWSLVLCAGAARSPETEVLGGPCLEEGETGASGSQEWHGLVSRHADAVRRGARDEAIALAKRIVRSRCSNEFWWLKLAESLVELNRLEESVAVLEALYSRGSNAVDRRLRTPESPLNRLLESNVYRRSALAAKLAADRRALEQRRKEARLRMGAALRPPDDYVAWKACPFECCRFGTWSVLADTALYDRPGGTRVVGRAIKGERVEALTGEVHLRPLPVRVRYGPPGGFPAAEGSIVFLLNYLGEGYGRVWVNGGIVDAEILSVQEHCAFPKAACWGEFVNPADAGRERAGVWWVQVKTADGAAGWTKEVERFGGMDGCG